jgi:peptidyl-prolyl cis-trans isomerase SurA
MRIAKKIKICMMALSLLAVPLVLFAAEPLNRIVAVVNNEVITLHELNTRIKEMTGMTPVELKDRNEKVFLDARQQIIELMIDEKIAEAKIKELGIKVSQKQLDEAIERMKSENRWTQEDLVAALQKEGISYEKLREKVKKDLERMHLINSEVKSKIIITDDRIRKYYEEHKAQYVGDAKVHLAGIFLLRKGSAQEENEELLRKGEEILNLLKKGEDFAGLAKIHSDGPGAGEGGELGSFRISQLEPDLQSLLRDMPVGGNSGLIERRNGIQIIKLLEKEGGEGKGLGEVKDAIFSAIYREEVDKRYMSWIKELRERSYTQIIF